MTPDAETALGVTRQFATFEEWWEPFTLGVGAVGGYVASLDSVTREQLRERCRPLLPDGPFSLSPRVWAVCAATVRL